MSGRIVRPVLIALVVGLGLLDSGGVRAADSVLSVKELNALKREKWSRYAENRVTLKIEGRCSSNSGSVLKLQKSELLFKIGSSKRMPRFVERGGSLQITGRLTHKSGKYQFQVSSIEERPTDLEEFRTRKKEIRDGDSADWYALGEWARDRAAFYEDRQLAGRADEALLQGIRVERDKLAGKDAQALLNLAKEIRRRDLDESVRNEFIHEAYRIKWKALRKQKPPAKNRKPNAGKRKPSALDEFAEELVGVYPECTERLEAPLTQLEKRYRKDPVPVYQSSGRNRRKTLHRMFYNEVILFTIEQDADEDGSNGYEIAARIEKGVPEHRELAETYRDRELDYKSSMLEVFDRDEAVALANQYRDRKQAQKAQKTLVDWLKAMRKRVPDNDSEGLRQLAEQYLNLIDDREKSLEILLAAYKANPKSQEVAADLRRTGLKLVGGEWLTKTEANAVPVDPLKRDMQAGLVTVGMTSTQVKQSLGTPTDITRAATSGRIHEVWVYRDGLAVGVTVHFLRRGVRENVPLKVIRSY